MSSGKYATRDAFEVSPEKGKGHFLIHMSYQIHASKSSAYNMIWRSMHFLLSNIVLMSATEVDNQIQLAKVPESGMHARMPVYGNAVIPPPPPPT